MAWGTQALDVLVLVLTTFSQGDDVVTFGRLGDAPLPVALGAQWRTSEQGRAHRLETAAGYALRRGDRLDPRFTRMPGAAPAGVTHQGVAAKLSTGAWC